MLDFIKRLVLFAIGFYIVLFIARNTLGGFSLTGIASEIRGAISEIQKIGKGVNGGTTIGGVAASSSLSKYTKTSKGSENAVEFINLSRGEMVGTKSTILGNIDQKWLFENVGTARFLNEIGEVLGTAPVVTEGLPTPSGKLPFSILPQFTQGSAKTGYVVIEKVNNTGQAKNDAWFTVPITYPVTTTTQSGTNTTNQGSQVPFSTGTSIGGAASTSTSGAVNTTGSIITPADTIILHNR